MRTATVTICLMLILGAAAAAEFDDYKPSSFAALTKGVEPDSKIDQDLFPGTEGWRVKAVFTGKIREITKEHRTHVEMWAKMVGHPPTVAEMFVHEVELRENDKLFWVPLQENLVEHLEGEVSPGTEATFYVLHLGYCKTEPIFIVNEFESEAVPGKER